MQRLLLSALGRSFIGWRWIVALLLLVSVLVGFAGPAWWSQRGVLTPEAAPDDFALVNQGQLKQIALAAFREIEAKIPGGAGPELNAALDSWTTPDANNVRVAKVTPATDDFATVNVGQVRSLAKPFYDRLYTVGRVQTYPWSDSPSDDDDFAFANIGQVKNVFSFDLGPGTPTGLASTPGNLQITLQWNAVPGATAYEVRRSATPDGAYQPLPGNPAATNYTNTGLADGATYYYDVIATNGQAWSFPSNTVSSTAILDTDNNGLHDSWEMQHFGAPGQDPDGDPDGDGLSNLQEYKQNSNPLDFFNGQIPGLAVLSGQDQTGIVVAPLPQPFTVRVTRDGAPLSNAPVSFTAPAPGLGATAGSSPLQTQLTVRTNAAGDASCFFTLPAAEGTHTIQVAAGTATASFNATAYVVPAAPVFSFPAGTYATARSVTASSATAGARIHYTLDGSEPTASSASVESGGVIPVAA